MNIYFVLLWQACTSELIVLRAARRYHDDTDSIVFADNSPYTRDFYYTAGMSVSTTDSIFKFCKKMALMKVDNAEYALLAGIAIFSGKSCKLFCKLKNKMHHLLFYLHFTQNSKFNIFFKCISMTTLKFSIFYAKNKI